MSDGMSSLEALILVRKNNCRVTFGSDVVIEVQIQASEQGQPVGTPMWCEAGRAATFVEAAKLAAEVCSWER